MFFWMLSVEALGLACWARRAAWWWVCCVRRWRRLAGWAFAVHGGYVLLAVLCSSGICLGFSLFPVRYLDALNY